MNILTSINVLMLLVHQCKTYVHVEILLLISRLLINRLVVMYEDKSMHQCN